MKKTAILLLMFVVTLGTTTFAQNERKGKKTAEERTEMVVKRLTEKLTLNDDQAKNIREVVLNREKMREAGQLNKDNRTKIIGQINKYLTKEQQDKWEQIRTEAREHRNHKHHGSDSKATDDTGDDVY